MRTAENSLGDIKILKYKRLEKEVSAVKITESNIRFVAKELNKYFLSSGSQNKAKIEKEKDYLIIVVRGDEGQKIVTITSKHIISLEGNANILKFNRKVFHKIHDLVE